MTTAAGLDLWSYVHLLHENRRTDPGIDALLGYFKVGSINCGNCIGLQVIGFTHRLPKVNQSSHGKPNPIK